MFYLLSFIYGAAIGSFVQVVATRLNVAPIIRARSKCLSCGEALRILDVIPVVSYLFLKGKCRYCKSPYGVQALLVEASFGTLFVLLYHFILLSADSMTALWWFAYYTMLFITLGVISLYDYRHSYVPVAYLSFFSMLSLIMMSIRFVYEPSVSILLGPLFVSFPFLLIWIITKGRALGFGDVLLYAGVGAFFGIEQGLAVLLLSIWIGAVAGVLIYLKRRHAKNVNTAIPFVPFIVIGFLIVLFTDMSVFTIASLFSW